MHDLQTTADAAAPPRPVPTSPRSPRVATWIVVAAAVVLVIGPLLGGGLYQERARWRLAAGLEHWLDGDLPAALAELDAAAKLAPDDPRVYQLRSQWRTKAGDYAGALADAERLAELAPRDLETAQLKADALIYLGRADEAARTWIELAEQTPDQHNWSSPEMQNSIAYYRALGEVGLKTALAQINAAITRRRLGAAWRESQAAFLDTRGYIHYLREDYQEALDDLNAAVLAAERRREEERLKWGRRAAQSMADPRVADQVEKSFDRTVAVIRYHRALVLEELDRTDAAERDYRRIRQLGFEPGPQLF